MKAESLTMVMMDKSERGGWRDERIRGTGFPTSKGACLYTIRKNPMAMRLQIGIRYSCGRSKET